MLLYKKLLLMTFGTTPVHCIYYEVGTEFLYIFVR